MAGSWGGREIEKAAVEQKASKAADTEQCVRACVCVCQCVCVCVSVCVCVCLPVRAIEMTAIIIAC